MSVVTKGPRVAGQGDVQVTNRFPNLFYNVIAVVCVVLLVAEVAGQLKGDGVKMAILVGLALLALLAPNIESLTLGKSGLVASLRKGIEENSNKIDKTNDGSRENEKLLDQKVTQVIEELRALRGLIAPQPAAPSAAEPAAGVAVLELPEIIDKDDPQRGRFGGLEEANGRRLSATVDFSSVDPDWCTVTLKVTSTRGAPELTGTVEFYLHHTFRPDRYTVAVLKGEATLSLRAWGAFTAGALADGGNTRLELNLATSPKVVAPAEWRAR